VGKPVRIITLPEYFDEHSGALSSGSLATQFSILPYEVLHVTGILTILGLVENHNRNPR
jgi:hypothetical protein